MFQTYGAYIQVEQKTYKAILSNTDAIWYLLNYNCEVIKEKVALICQDIAHGRDTACEYLIKVIRKVFEVNNSNTEIAGEMLL